MSKTASEEFVVDFPELDPPRKILVSVDQLRGVAVELRKAIPNAEKCGGTITLQLPGNGFTVGWEFTPQEAAAQARRYEEALARYDKGETDAGRALVNQDAQVPVPLVKMRMLQVPLRTLMDIFEPLGFDAERIHEHGYVARFVNQYPLEECERLIGIHKIVADDSLERLRSRISTTMNDDEWDTILARIKAMREEDLRRLYFERLHGFESRKPMPLAPRAPKRREAVA